MWRLGHTTSTSKYKYITSNCKVFQFAQQVATVENIIYFSAINNEATDEREQWAAEDSDSETGEEEDHEASGDYAKLLTS